MTDSLFSFCNLICSDGEESLHQKRDGQLHEQCAACAGKMTNTQCTVKLRPYFSKKRDLSLRLKKSAI